MVYRWLWDHLPGPDAVKVALAGVVAAAVAAVLLILVVPLMHPMPAGPPVDGTGIDQDGVVEPDGVRATPLPTPEVTTPPPDVPGDSDAQQ